MYNELAYTPWHRHGVWLAAGRGKGGESGISLSGLNSWGETKNPRATEGRTVHRAGANWTDRATCLPFDDVIRRPF